MRHRHHDHDNRHHDHINAHGGADGHRGRRFARAERRRDSDHAGDAPLVHRGGRFRHGRDGDHPGRELRRFFAHGDLRLVILRLIADKPRHGYEIIKEIEERVGGAYSPSPGVIYPTLTMLEELGYVAITPGEGARKRHEITDAGRSFLAANGPAVEALFARMTAVLQATSGGPEPRILRAMENLKLALRLRLSRGPLTAEQIAAVAATLDSAAASVEAI